MLSCHVPGCYDAQWYWHAPEDFSAMPLTARRRRCCSCKKLIDPGTPVNVFDRTRPAISDVEERIFGEDGDAVSLAPWYQCETCADLYWSLTELGFHVSPEDDMHELLKEYVELVEYRKEKALKLKEKTDATE